MGLVVLGRLLRGSPDPVFGAKYHGSVFDVRLDRAGKCWGLPGLRMELPSAVLRRRKHVSGQPDARSLPASTLTPALEPVRLQRQRKH